MAVLTVLAVLLSGCAKGTVIETGKTVDDWKEVTVEFEEKRGLHKHQVRLPKSTQFLLLFRKDSICRFQQEQTDL